MKVSIDPACAANTRGMSSCDVDRPSLIAVTTTTGKRAATAPLTLIRTALSLTTAGILMITVAGAPSSARS